MKYKKLLSLGLSILIACSTVITISASEGSNFVGLRTYEEAIGHTVLWDRSTNSITVLDDETLLYTLLLGQNTISFNGVTLPLDENIDALNGVTYLSPELLEILHGPRPMWLDEQLIIPIGFLPEVNDLTQTFVLEDVLDLKSFCNTYGKNTTILSHLYDAQFFKEHNLILGYVASSSTAERLVEVESTIENNTLSMSYCMTTDGMGSTVMGGNLIVAKAPKSVNTATLSKNFETISYSYNFELDNAEFDPIFADYHDDANNLLSYDMRSDYTLIPVSEVESKGLYIASHNRSDDIFMGYVKELQGLDPFKDYTFEIKFKLATNVEGGMIGIGGSPGSAVIVKAGIVSEEPVVKQDALGVYRFANMDIGSQTESGADMQAIGTIEKSMDNYQEGFDFKNFQHTVTATSNENGTIYLMIGTDSGFEGFTEYYLDDVEVIVK